MIDFPDFLLRQLEKEVSEAMNDGEHILDIENTEYEEGAMLITTIKTEAKATGYQLKPGGGISKGEYDY